MVEEFYFPFVFKEMSGTVPRILTEQTISNPDSHNSILKEKVHLSVMVRLSVRLYVLSFSACASIDYIFFLLDIMSVFLPYSFRNGYIKKVIPVSFWCSFKREIKLFNPSSFKAVTFQVCPIWHFLMDFFLLMGRPLLRCLTNSVIFFIYIWLYSAMNMQKGLYLYEQFYT